MSNGPGIFKRIARLFGGNPKTGATKDGATHDAPMLMLDAPIGHAGSPFGRVAKFQIGDVVRHRLFPFRGVIFDVDAVFSNSDEWYEAIPEEVRPSKNQPYYHLFAENEKTHYVAYVSEQNLELDDSETPVGHPDIPDVFDVSDKGYVLKREHAN